MKDRITDYINFIERATDFIKEKNKEIEEIKSAYKKETNEEAKNELLVKHFVQTQYSAMVYQDIQKAIFKLAECYSVGMLTAAQHDMDFTEEESKILEKYVQDASSIFVLEAGQIKPKQADLMDVMNKKAETIKHAEFINSYKENFLK